MPPKKKVEPEVLQQQFEQWQETVEYKKWQEMSEGLKKFPPITETTLDINGPWQDYFDELMKFFGVMKAKTGKIKDIKQETVRSFFFAREDKETEKIIIDGIPCGVVKEHADRSWTLRHKFCDILKEFNEFEELNYENFQTNKKNLSKSIQEFFKYYNPHVKSGHKDIYENKIFKVLEPLSNLIEINARFVVFNRKYKSLSDKEIRSFKMKALCEKYCIAYSEILRILDEESKDYKLITRHDLKHVFYKLSYCGWQENSCEKLYLLPLSTTFAAMQKELMQMYALGVNFWKVPLVHNEDFLRELENMIRAEVIADRLLGTPLKRELFNFIHQVLALIKRASPHLETNMLKKDENSTMGSIPKLVVFKMIQHMYAWRQRKDDHETAQAERVQRLQIISSMKTGKSSTMLSTSAASLANRSNDVSLNNSSSAANLSGTATSPSFFNNKKDTVVETSSALNGKNDTSLCLNTSNVSGLSSLTTGSNCSSRSRLPMHTSTSQKVLKVISTTLPVVIPAKSSATTNKQEIFNFADDLEAKSVLSNNNTSLNTTMPIPGSQNENENDEGESENQLKLFGRYFYLDGLIPAEKLAEFENCVGLLRNINPAVQQDIQDNIMLNGITPKTNGRHDVSRVNARMELERLQENDFANVSVNAIRPPELWNYPAAVGSHAFRSIAKPRDSYVDGRVELFDEKLETLASSLVTFKPDSWKEIVSRAIDVFADSYNKSITPVNPAENFG